MSICDHRSESQFKHSWFIYIDKKASLRENTALLQSAKNLQETTRKMTYQVKPQNIAIKVLPSLSVSVKIGKAFWKWLTGSGGGCKKYRSCK